MTKNISLLAGGLIAVMGFICYFNTLNGAFIWDDLGLVRDNVFIKDWSNLGKIFTKNIQAGAGGQSSFYRPAVMLSYMIDYSLWKLRPAGYHFTNILFHIFTGLSVYWLMRILFKNSVAALFIGILFIVHPVHTETVAYISDRADMLAALFILLGFIFYLKYLDSKKLSDYLLMLLVSLLAFFSKENSLILPGMVLVYHYSFKKRISRAAYFSLLGLTFMYVLFRLTVLESVDKHHAWMFTILARIPGVFAALANYLRLLLFPARLHMEYGQKIFSFSHPQVLLGMVLTGLSWIYFIRRRKVGGAVFFGGLWFFLAFLPVSNLCPLAFYMAEHWLYLPSIGFFLISGYNLSYVFKKEKYCFPAVLFLAGLVGIYSGLTIKQNSYWRDPITFYQRTLNYAPDSARVCHNLAVAYHETGRDDQAIPLYQKAITLNPCFVEAYSNLGVTYKAMERNNDAAAAYKKAIEVDPDYAPAYSNLGVIYRQAGRVEAAVDLYKKAIELDAVSPDAYYNLGLAYLDLGRNQEAVYSFQKVIGANPDFADAYNNLGVVYNRIGRNQEAINVLKEAVRRNPHDSDFHSNLAVAYFNNQQYDLAVSHYEQAEKLGLINSSLKDALSSYRRIKKLRIIGKN